MKHFDWKIIGIIGIVVFSFLILFFGYQVSVGNTATRMGEQINESYSGIEIQQKHRNDSIKQLVQVVENFTSHEQDIVNSVTDARAKLQEGDISGALKSLNVVVENYPEIKSDTLYSDLMKEISSCENLIASYRDNYNQQVKEYKKYIKVFPHKQILSIQGYEPIEVDYLTFDSEELEVIENMFGE